MLEADIYAHLSTSTGVTAQTSTRIYPIVLPQNTEYPAQSYQRVGTYPVYSLSGYSSYENARIIIDSWATSYSAAKTLSRATHKAMNAATAFKAIMDGESDLFDPEINLYRVSQSYSCWQATT